MDERLLTEAQEIAYGGERVTHLYPNDCYFAHLSIYYYALQYALEKKVLDAGCGSGYGSYYLRKNGARQVEALDISRVAIGFCKKYFSYPKLRFRISSLVKINGYKKRTFDLIFTSNVLEHVPDVTKFLDKAHMLLKPDGVLLIAVPPVVDETSRKNNIDNKYHLNIWTPRQWYMAISTYFDQVQCVFHSFKNQNVVLDFGNTPENTRVNEKDFTFEPVMIDEFYKEAPLTVMFEARSPVKSNPKNPSFTFIEESLTRALVVDDPPMEPRRKSNIGILTRLSQFFRKFVGR